MCRTKLVVIQKLHINIYIHVIITSDEKVDKIWTSVWLA
jgi:hypothetical protein